MDATATKSIGQATGRGRRQSAPYRRSGVVLLVLALILGAQTGWHGSSPPIAVGVPTGSNVGTRSLPLVTPPPSPAVPRGPFRELLANRTIAVGYGPISAAFDPNDGYVYVADNGPNNRSTNGNVTVINGSSVAGSVDVAGYPSGISFDPFNGYLYISYIVNGTSATGAVLVVDGTSPVASLAVGEDPAAAVVDPSSGEAYVLNRGSDNVSVINGTSVVAAIPVGSEPGQAVFDAASGYVYVVNTNISISGSCNGNISVLDGITPLTSIPDPDCPSSAVYDPVDGEVYVANWGGRNVSVINGTSVAATVSVGGSPNVTAVDARTGDVYVSNVGNISVIQGTAIVATLETGWYGGEGAGVYDPASGYVYLLNTYWNNVTVVDGTSLLPAIPVGDEPMGATFDSGNGLVYVANFGSNNLSVLGGSSQYPEISSFAAQPSEVPLHFPTNFEVNASGGIGPLSYLYTGLPSGCSTSNDSDLSCTPMSAGLFSVEVFVNDSGGLGVTATTELSVVPYLISEFEADPSTVRVGANTTFTVDLLGGGVGPMTYQYTGLPGGCGTENTSTLNCTPGGAGNYHVSVFVNDTQGGNATASTWLLVSNATAGSGLFPLTFVAFGLPIGTSWTVTIDGTARTTSSSSQGFEAPNGTYSFAVGLVGGYKANQTSGTVTVAGAAVNRTIDFTRAPGFVYSLNFTETGLPMGSSWSVLVNGTLRSTTGDEATFPELNGTFGYVIPTVPGYNAVPSGTVQVNGTSVDVPVAFTVPTFLVVFIEFGLPAGTNWSVTLWNSSIGFNETHRSTTDTISFLLPNGTFDISAAFPPGFTGTASPGTVTVAGSTGGVPSVISVSRSSSGTSPPESPATPMFGSWAVLVGLVVVLAVGTISIGYRMGRRSKRPPSSDLSASSQLAVSDRGAVSSSESTESGGEPAARRTE
jgi:YVTN family beta-propeller protein